MPTRHETIANSRLIMLGVGGGLVAGTTLAVVHLLLALLSHRPVFQSFRLGASIVLGGEVLDPRYSLLDAGMAGLVMHGVLSVVYGLLFVYWLKSSAKLQASSGALLVYGWLFGLTLWVVNLLIIAPLGFPQFNGIDHFWDGFLAHSFAYGTMLGGHVAVGLDRDSNYRVVLEEVIHA